MGVGEQDAVPFAEEAWKTAGLKKSRIVIPYDVALKRGATRAKMDRFYLVSRQQGVELLVAFNPTEGAKCPQQPCPLPSVSAYRRAFQAFRKRYPGLKVVAPVNEANHNTQPTFRNPRRAAEYYNVVRRDCRGCKIVAADILDESNMRPWLEDFKRTAERPSIWGLHNYKDTNPRPGQRLGGTGEFLRIVPRGEVWLTETGGIVEFQLANGKTLFPSDEKRATRNTAAHVRPGPQAPRPRRPACTSTTGALRCTDNRFDAGLLRRRRHRPARVPHRGRPAEAPGRILPAVSDTDTGPSRLPRRARQRRSRRPATIPPVAWR